MTLMSPGAAHRLDTPLVGPGRRWFWQEWDWVGDGKVMVHPVSLAFVRKIAIACLTEKQNISFSISCNFESCTVA